MAINIRTKLSLAVGVVLVLGTVLMQCTIDKVDRPEPRIDLLVGGDEPDPDLDSIQTVGAGQITVHLFAVAGLRSYSITADDSTLSDKKYGAKAIVTCDTVDNSLAFSGNDAYNRTLSISVTDWQDQTTEKTLVFVYTPGEVLAVRPRIASNGPNSQSVTLGGTVTFVVTVTNTTPNYQWQKNGADISGATNTTYTIPPATRADSGATFRCIAYNRAGRDTSYTATLTVIIPVAPTVTGSPQSTSVIAGESATFSITASGTSPTYQWQKNGDDIVDANYYSYTTPATVIGDNGATFRCIVSNTLGRDTSSAATLTVTPVIIPSFTTQPRSDTVGVGESVTFSALAAGTTPSYQWQRGGQNILYATNTTYAISSATLKDSGAVFRCIATNSAGSDTSDLAVLIVHLIPPTITSHPQSAAVQVNQRATFQVYATGTALAYQWQKNSVDIDNATDTSYTTPLASNSDNGAQFRCIVSNGAGRDTSNAATLTVAVLVAPQITSEPEDASVTAPQTATFTVTASGTSPSYQWQKSGTNITGAQSSSYTTPATTVTDNGATFRCIVRNGAGADTSRSATLSVTLIAPQISSDPKDVAVEAGNSASFSVTASGATPSFQWQRNGSDISGAQSSSYSISITVMGDSGATFRCIVTNAAGSDTSAAATLTVTRPPVAALGQSYGGGKVFYVDPSGQHGLIAATSDLSSGALWGCDDTSLTGTSAALGTGQANTTAIVAGCSSTGTAARLCNDLSSGGYSDWFLPSKDELDSLYHRSGYVGAFTGTAYWSSTQNNSGTAALQFFQSGYQINASKATAASVRAIRAF